MGVSPPRTVSRSALAVSLAALCSIAVTAVPAAAADADEALCHEAEDRYVDLFGAPSAQAKDATVVLMYRYRFCPAAITVKPGTTVRWVNVDKRTSHSVLVPDTGKPESDRAFPEEIIEMTFLSVGDHKYLCGPHWETHDMIGMVTVAE